ncbi:MAG TPA: hydrogenase nickel incorporation protein HypB [Armatimonadetes bacterium]|nr:hydrogenase nickel incorporation protein HypB [Armatimonadota bacterium]
MERRTQRKRVLMLQNLLQANDLIAKRINQSATEAGTLLVNMLSSPGSGKTTLLEATARRVGGSLRIGAILGDVATDRDYERLRKHGISAVQIVTGGECHLEAAMVEQALQEIDFGSLDIVFIENVGNLVCPSEFQLGEHVRVVLLSTAEGEDKSIKYPMAFRTAQALIITKMDLLPHVPFDIDAAVRFALQVNPKLQILTTSAVTGDGLDDWLSLLNEWHNDMKAVGRSTFGS